MSRAPGIERKLTTILAADAANYSGRMAQDEEGTVRALRKSFEAIRALIEMRGGRVANTAGDGLIAEFPSVVEAAAAAVSIQKTLNADPEHLAFRIGLHLGDVIVEGDDLLGDGVNLAARLQEIAPEGGIIASQQVVDHARGRLSAEFRPLGPATLKHLPEDIAVYGVIAQGIVAPGDLAPVLPKTAVAQAPHPVSAPPAATPPLSKVEKFKKTQNRTLYMIGGIFAVDLFTGGGFWSFWPIAVLGAFWWVRRWRFNKAK